MSAHDGFRADTESMDRITKGIKLAMDELKELGFDVDANLGRGFDKLELAGLEVGDEGLHESFAGFCDEWGWGVRGLMQYANRFAAGVGLSAGRYHEEEQYLDTTFKKVINQVGGNPYITDEEAQRQSFGDAFLATTPYGHIESADYSGESVAEALQAGEQAREQIGDDFDSSTWTPRQDNTEWQWDGPPEQEAPEGEGER